MSHYDKHVFVCLNQREDGRRCCNDQEATRLWEYMKSRAGALGLLGEGRMRINKAGCLDRCEEGPALVVYPDGVWYTYVDTADIDEIIHEHLQHGRIVERLRI